MRLKKTQTVDRSTPASAGAVIGDASPPVQTYTPPSPPLAPRAVSPPPAPAATNGHHEEERAAAVVEEPEPAPLAPIVAEEADPLDAVDLGKSASHFTAQTCWN